MYAVVLAGEIPNNAQLRIPNSVCDNTIVQPSKSMQFKSLGVDNSLLYAIASCVTIGFIMAMNNVFLGAKDPHNALLNGCFCDECRDVTLTNSSLCQHQ